MNASLKHREFITLLDDVAEAWSRQARVKLGAGTARSHKR
jgi:hypothetical protein